MGQDLSRDQQKLRDARPENCKQSENFAYSTAPRPTRDTASSSKSPFGSWRADDQGSKKCFFFAKSKKKEKRGKGNRPGSKKRKRIPA